ncbi:secondary thiamine-phosphate synthase enzyme YjbQ [Pontibacterium granulatum]|uniref:secondary thiamine-phosphate synthase enzyme YjbQ n=1 Tax=Pontibacterium granulatum TaxID=2036029 RepID=UPI00249A7B85|nr:secondary thiamine-phosphate synthase enzyme YjbQ [Pontibacterium granulatum]MDI3326228.1 secondary thiamine-phosphate synthase enzyme YjbQ [Pontibacterium granulatum]
MVKTLSVKTGRQGLFEFTSQLQKLVAQSGINDGLCSLLIQHTSASLTIQENADPSAKVDLENWMNRLVPENDPLYTHTLEGVDDMPAHIKAALTSTTLSIPVLNGCLALGTWQGVYCWEHRHHAGYRQIVVHIGE